MRTLAAAATSLSVSRCAIDLWTMRREVAEQIWPAVTKMPTCRPRGAARLLSAAGCGRQLDAVGSWVRSAARVLSAAGCGRQLGAVGSSREAAGSASVGSGGREGVDGGGSSMDGGSREPSLQRV